jgi:sugar phosphate isomerase/epimerase
MSQITRRQILKSGASALAVAPLAASVRPAGANEATQVQSGGSLVPNPYGRRGLGGAPTGFGARSRTNAAATPPVDFVDYCHSIGLSGAEVRTPPTDAAEIGRLRARLESYQMRVLFDFPLPKSDAEIPQFDALVKAAKEVGANGIRAALTQRRYEQFDTFDAFKQNFEMNKALVARSEPTLRKYKLPVVLENHKGWRAAEHAAWLKGLGSEYVGVLFDFGNNVSLCEDPMQTLDTLLPYVKSCHIKDVAVQPYEEGFLLSEVPLGDGFLDLKGMVERIRHKDPDIGFNLEMITRDPLKIPILTPKYWATFDDSYSPFPARDLARTFAFVKHNPPKKPLPKTSGLSPSEQLKQEDDNNRLSIEWARANLQM